MKVAMKDITDSLPGRVVNATPILRGLTTPNNKLRGALELELKKSRALDPGTFDDLIELMQPATKATTTQAKPNLTIDQAMRFKSALDAYGRKKFTDEGGQRLATAAQLEARRVDDAIKTSLGGMPTLLRSYESSQAMYAAGVATFKGDLVKQAFMRFNKEPGLLADIVLGGNKVDTVKALREAVGNSVWQATVEPKLGAHLLLKSFGEEMTGPLSGTALANRVQSLAVNGTMEAAFSLKTYRTLLDLAETIEHVTPTPKGAGGVLIQLTQAGVIGVMPGAIAGVASGDVGEGVTTGLGVAATVLLAPRVLGKLVADERLPRCSKRG